MASVQLVAEHQTLKDDPDTRRAQKISRMLLKLTQFRSQPARQPEPLPENEED